MRACVGVSPIALSIPYLCAAVQGSRWLLFHGVGGCRIDIRAAAHPESRQPMPRRTNRFPLLLITGAAAWLILRLARKIILDRNRDFFRGKVVILTGASRGI